MEVDRISVMKNSGFGIGTECGRKLSFGVVSVSVESTAANFSVSVESR